MVRQCHERKEIMVDKQFTPTDKQIADILTKNLCREIFEKHRRQLMGVTKVKD